MLVRLKEEDGAPTTDDHAGHAGIEADAIRPSLPYEGRISCQSRPRLVAT